MVSKVKCLDCKGELAGDYDEQYERAVKEKIYTDSMPKVICEKCSMKYRTSKPKKGFKKKLPKEVNDMVTDILEKVCSNG